MWSGKRAQHLGRYHAIWAPLDAPRKQQKPPEPIQRRQDHDEEISYITLNVLYPDEEVSWR